jgi:hypothetical protein
MTEPIPVGTTEGAISTATVSPTPNPDLSELGASDTTMAPQDPTAPEDAPVAEPDPDAPPDAPTVSLVDDPQAQAVSAPATPEVPAVPATATEPAIPAVPAQPERVLVSPADPVLGAKVAQWLEHEAAIDARLSPLVDRLVFLPNVYLSFDKDDSIFLVPAAA